MCWKNSRSENPAKDTAPSTEPPMAGPPSPGFVTVNVSAASTSRLGPEENGRVQCLSAPSTVNVVESVFSIVTPTCAKSEVFDTAGRLDVCPAR